MSDAMSDPINPVTYPAHTYRAHTYPSHARPTRTRGLSLVELMVAMAICLLIVAAAAYVYLATRDTQRAVDDASTTQDYGAAAIDLIGREVQNAGFFPAHRGNLPPPAAGALQPDPPPGRYVNPSALAAYGSGLFGCAGGVFDPATGTCPATQAAQADSLVVNYYTNDAFGAEVGQSTDCNQEDVGKAAINAGRANATAGKAPLQPLFVSNVYALVDTTIAVEGNNVKTRSLACRGIAGTAFQPLLIGIEDLRITYGVHSNFTSLSPERFYTATEVSALPTLPNPAVRDQNTGALAPWPAWGRVTAVRVCVTARSVGGGTRIADAAAQPRSYVDCSGKTVTLPANDRSIRRTFVQVFAVRNNLTQTF